MEWKWNKNIMGKITANQAVMHIDEMEWKWK